MEPDDTEDETLDEALAAYEGGEPGVTEGPKTLSESDMALLSSKRPAPAVVVPPAARPSQFVSNKVKELQVMLRDLGFFPLPPRGRIDGHYGNETRNAVSLLQQRLNEEGVKLRPDGNFTAATRQALLDSSIPTVE